MVTIQQIAAAGVLVALGYVIGQDGRRQMIVAAAGPDGRTPQLTDFTDQIGRISPNGAPSQGLLLLEYDVPQRLADSIEPRTASAVSYLETLLDTKLAMNALIVLDSTCDQDLTIQVVGHTGNSPTDGAGLVNIEASQTLSAGSAAATRLSLGIDLTGTNWFPWLGVTITAGSTPPTAGVVSVYGYSRSWRRRESGLLA